MSISPVIWLILIVNVFFNFWRWSTHCNKSMIFDYLYITTQLFVSILEINDTAYGLNFGFEISNVSMSQNVQFRNGTYLVVQNSINGLVSWTHFDTETFNINKTLTWIFLYSTYINLNNNHTFCCTFQLNKILSNNSAPLINFQPADFT